MSSPAPSSLNAEIFEQRKVIADQGAAVAEAAMRCSTAVPACNPCVVPKNEVCMKEGGPREQW